MAGELSGAQGKLKSQWDWHAAFGESGRAFSIPVAAHGVLAIQASRFSLTARGEHEKVWSRACLDALSGCSGNARGATRRCCTSGPVQEEQGMSGFVREMVDKHRTGT